MKKRKRCKRNEKKPKESVGKGRFGDLSQSPVAFLLFKFAFRLGKCSFKVVPSSVHLCGRFDDKEWH